MRPTGKYIGFSSAARRGTFVVAAIFMFSLVGGIFASSSVGALSMWDLNGLGNSVNAGDGNDTNTNTDNTPPPSPPSLAVSVSASKTNIDVNANASFTVTVSNGASAGPTTGEITVTDNVPAEFSIQIEQLASDCSSNGQTVTCKTSEKLAAGASKKFTIPVVAVKATDSITNSASVTGGGDTNCASGDACSGSITVTVAAPAGAGDNAPSTGFARFIQNPLTIGGIGIIAAALVWFLGRGGTRKKPQLDAR